MRLEQHLEKLLPQWPTFKIQFHELWIEPGYGPLCGGWSVNDSWTPFAKATRQETIGHLRARWEVFKLNYMPQGRVKDIENTSCDEWEITLDCAGVAFATLQVPD